MRECTYKRCTRKAGPYNPHCIFHMSLKEKRENLKLKERFETEFLELYKADDWDFTGFVFPDNMDLSREAGYDFCKKGKKTKPAIFRETKFGNAVNFHGAQFADIDFIDAQFSGAINFNRAQFSETINFWRTRFEGDSNFKLAHFSDIANFWHAQFMGDADFSFAPFSREANFEHAQFNEEAKFSNTIFGATTYFEGAQFMKDVNFNRAQFKGNVNCNAVRFSRTSDFTHTQFSGTVYFKYAQFGGTVDFSHARFGEKTDCELAPISGKVYLKGATFSTESRFKKTVFNQPLDFSEIKGRAPAYEGRGGPADKGPAWGVELFQPGPPALVFEMAKFNGPAEFHRVDLSHTRFQQVNLRNISFLHSQISKTKFISCVWGDGPENSKLWHRSDKGWRRFRRPRLLFDELLWRKITQLGKKNQDQEGQTTEDKPGQNDAIDKVNITKPPYKDLEASDIEVLALQLKQSLEATRDPIPAGDFHFAAMEMKREQDWHEWRESKKAVKKEKEYRKNQKEKAWASRLWAWGSWLCQILSGYGECSGRQRKAWACRRRAGAFWWYKMISGYGECYGRTLLWLVIWLIGFTVLYFYLGGIGPAPLAKQAWIFGAPPGFSFLREIWYAFAFSAQHILPMKLAADYIQPTGPHADLIQALAMLETITGTTLFTFFALALRRRFKR